MMNNVIPANAHQEKATWTTYTVRGGNSKYRPIGLPARMTPASGSPINIRIRGTSSIRNRIQSWFPWTKRTLAANTPCRIGGCLVHDSMIASRSNFNRKETMAAARVYGDYRKYKHPIFTIPPDNEQILSPLPSPWASEIWPNPLDTLKNCPFPPAYPVESQPPGMPISCCCFRSLNGWFVPFSDFGARSSSVRYRGKVYAQTSSAAHHFGISPLFRSSWISSKYLSSP